MTASPTRPPAPLPYTVLIPARLASTRLPDKPLADIGGAPMVVRVAQRASLSGARQVVVATDSERIERACAAHGVVAVMTRPDHVCGSDRLAEACALLQLPDGECVVNVQGDEPLVAAPLIDAVALELQQRPDCEMSTAAHPILAADEYANPNVVKVVTDRRGTALYFSRAPIPWWRDGMAQAWQQGVNSLPPQTVLRHVGVYGYRAAFLRAFPALPLSPLEATESLEQLRVLWHGHRIAVHISAEAPGPGVDTPQDLERVRQIWAAL